MRPWQGAGVTAGLLIGLVTGFLLYIRYFPNARHDTREEDQVAALIFGCVVVGAAVGKLVDYCLGL
jgi:hypothetical protein